METGPLAAQGLRALGKQLHEERERVMAERAPAPERSGKTALIAGLAFAGAALAAGLAANSAVREDPRKDVPAAKPARPEGAKAPGP